MKRNVLVTLADANYIDQAKQLFSGVYWNAGWDGDYLLLAHDIPEEKLTWFRQKGILIYECRPVSENSSRDNFPVSVYSKAYLFKTFFKKWEKVIYLDGDIIVTHSFDGLLDTKGFAAKSDFNMDLYYQLRLSYDKKIDNVDLIQKNIMRLMAEYDLTSDSFNSGVMVIDTSIIQEDSFDRLVALITEYRSLSNFGEQLVLNLFMYKKWNRIENYYNAFALYPEVSFSLYKRKGMIPVFHFLGSKNKPWSEDHPFKSVWKANLEKADDIDLKKIPSLKMKFSDTEKIYSKKLLTEKEKPFMSMARYNFYFSELDILYRKNSMREFRYLLVRGMMKQYTKGYNRFIPYYFISFVPIPFKLLIKKALFQ